MFGRLGRAQSSCKLRAAMTGSKLVRNDDVAMSLGMPYSFFGQQVAGLKWIHVSWSSTCPGQEHISRRLPTYINKEFEKLALASMHTWWRWESMKEFPEYGPHQRLCRLDPIFRNQFRHLHLAVIQLASTYLTA